jgi:stringent starvation protein B
MTSKKPYLIKAIYQWINDNKLTPHILIDTGFPNVNVPSEYIYQNQIAFNISEQATRDLNIGLEYMEFQASFNGVAHTVTFPICAIKTIYAEENVAEGMSFTIDYDDAKRLDKNTIVESSSIPENKKDKPKKKSHLRIVK